jgi:membrane protein
VARRGGHPGAWREHLTLRTLRAGLAAFQGEGLKLRAMALTYFSVFSLLPAMMVGVSVVKAFADLEAIRPRVQAFLVGNLAVGAREVVSDYLERHVFTAPLGSLGFLGFGLLVVSAAGLFSQVERAVNDIWAVRRRRPLLRRWLTYWAGLTIGPLLAVASVAAGLAAQDWLGGSRALWQAALLLATLAFFGGAYALLPATRVRPGPAAAAGAVAGLAFELSKEAYAWAVTHLFQFQALYGSLAAVFVSLLWLFVAWTIFLFGARLAFVLQHHRALLDLHDVEGSALSRELLGARALLAVALAFWDGERPPDPGEVADRLDAPAEPVRAVLSRLEAAGLVAEDEDGGLTPARPLARIALSDVHQVIAGDASGAARAARPPGSGAAGGEAPPAGAVAGEAGDSLGRLFAEAEGAAHERLSITSYDDLCRALRPGGSSQAERSREAPAEPSPRIPA